MVFVALHTSVSDEWICIELSGIEAIGQDIISHLCHILPHPLPRPPLHQPWLQYRRSDSPQVVYDGADLN